MSSPSSVFTLPEDFDHDDNDDYDENAFYGTSSSSSDAECCCSPIVSRSKDRQPKNNVPSLASPDITTLSEIVQSAARWSQAANTTRSIGGGDAIVFGTLSLDDDDISKKDKKKKKDWRNAAAASYLKCRYHCRRRQDADGRSITIIMPRWIAVAFLLTLMVSVVFFTRATTWWWQQSNSATIPSNSTSSIMSSDELILTTNASSSSSASMLIPTSTTSDPPLLQNNLRDPISQSSAPAGTNTALSPTTATTPSLATTHTNTTSNKSLPTNNNTNEQNEHNNTNTTLTNNAATVVRDGSSPISLETKVEEVVSSPLLLITDTNSNVTTNNGNGLVTRVKNDNAEFATTTHKDVLLSILKTLTPRRTLLNTSTPQGQAFAWLLLESSVDDSVEEEGQATRVRRRNRHLLEQLQQQQQSDVDMSSKRQQILERYVIVTLDFALHAATMDTTTSSSLSSLTNTTVPAVARANLPTCQWTGISCISGNSTSSSIVTINSTNINATTEIMDQKSAPASDDDNNTEDNVLITSLSWPGFNLTGQIPEEIKGLRHLMHLDLAENDLTGTLPQGLFSLQSLKNLYLHQNRLGGSLNIIENDDDNDASRKRAAGRLQGFAKLLRLESVYLGNNYFHGPIPTGLNVRGGKLQELRYLSLHQNRLTGPIPEQLNWHNLVYLDLSNNQFNGTLPAEWCQAKNITVRRLLEQPNNDTMTNPTFSMEGNDTAATTTTTTVTETRTKMTTALPHIRYLFLNHNQFSGTIPVDFPSVLGNGRVELLHLGDNEFYGHVPGDYSTARIFMTSLEVQNNHFTSMDPYICTLSVLTPPDGELVNLRADCPICSCPSLCKTPCPNNTFTSSNHHDRTKHNKDDDNNQNATTSASTLAVAGDSGT